MNSDLTLTFEEQKQIFFLLNDNDKQAIIMK